MGFSRHDLTILAEMKQRSLIPDSGRVVEVGAQQLTNSFLEARAEIAEFGKLFGVAEPITLRAPAPVYHTGGGIEILDAIAPPSRDFWEWLGFQYSAIDIDGSPGAIPLDLNFDAAPAEMRGRHDLVTNYGTTEHVVNQLNAFRMIHDLTAVGGLMIHNLPSHGMLTHGLINYTPKFFWMLARSNNYKFRLMDYWMEPCGQPLLPEIVDFIAQFRSEIRARLDACRSNDAGIDVVLQKIVDIPFVPPIDVPTGTQTSYEVLQDRYWTVFRPGRLLGVLAHERPMNVRGLYSAARSYGGALSRRLLRSLARARR
jgi:hypothetical protein